MVTVFVPLGRLETPGLCNVVGELCVIVAEKPTGSEIGWRDGDCNWDKPVDEEE